MTENGKPEVIFTFQNTHDAIASEQALIKYEVQVRVMPLPTQIGTGCGICLRVWLEVLAKANSILAANDIRVQGVWKKQTDDEKSQYVPY